MAVQILDSGYAVEKDRQGMVVRAVLYILPTGGQPIDHEAGHAVARERGARADTIRGTYTDEDLLVRQRAVVPVTLAYVVDHTKRTLCTMDRSGSLRRCDTMAWESRNGRGRYYTRSRRLNGRVMREYVGCGQVGAEAAEGDLERRQKLQAEQKEFKALRDQDQEMDDLVSSFGLVSEQLAKAALLLAGFRQQKLGEWRRCRERVYSG